MGKIAELHHQMHVLPSEPTQAPIDAEAVKQAIIKRIEKFDLEGVTVEDVEVDEEGILVSFVDYEDDQMDVYFVHDPEEGSVAIILGEEDDKEYLMVDLGPLAPSLIQHGSVQYINMAELSWFNKSALTAILMAGEVGTSQDDDLDGTMEQDDVEWEGDEDDGEFIVGPFKAVEGLVECLTEDLNELFASVVRGGKKVKLAIVKKVRRKRLSATKRMGIRSAARKRKQKSKRIARKIKRSLKVRKRMGLKKKKWGKFRKVAGTANRRA